MIRLRFVIVVAWVAGTAAAATLLPSLEQAQKGALGDLVPTGSQAIETEKRSAGFFPFPVLSRTLLVQRDPDGLSAAEQGRAVERALAINRDAVDGLEPIAVALPVTNALGGPPFAAERSTTAITALRFPPDVGRRDQERLGERLRDRVEREEDHFVGLTGVIPARDAQGDTITDALPRVELATLALVAIAVGLHFRALAAPALTLVSVALAYLTSIHVLAGLGERLGVSVPAEVEPVVVVLLFGVLTDYAIFFLSRFRQHLADGLPPRRAVESAIAELQGIVFTAGLTVAGATGALVLAQLGFFQAFGPGIALAVLIALLVALTFIPAGLAILGNAALWPSRPRSRTRRGRRERRRFAIVRVAARRPGLVAAGTTTALLVCAGGLVTLDVGQTVMRGLAPDAEPREAYAAASRGFAPGIMAPTVLLVEAPTITDERAGLERLQDAIEARPGVAEVIGPGDQPLRRALGAVLSPTGRAARLIVVFRGDPLGARAIEALKRLRRDLPNLLDRAGISGARASLAGDTALAEEVVRLTAADLVRVTPAALVSILITLGVFLRAIVAPLYLVAASVLGLGAALGLTALIAEHLLGYSELTFFVPFTAAVLLVSLGSDYNVFLAGRIWQEARARPLRDAVAEGGARAASAISVAGLVLALSFALLALVPVRAFRELALMMFIGLILDAFVVRTLLVPALITLFGRRSGWPGRALASRAPLEPPVVASPLPLAAVPAGGLPPRRRHARPPCRARAPRTWVSTVVLALAVFDGARAAVARRRP